MCIHLQAAMFGDGEAEPSKDHAVLLCWEACKVGLPLVLAHKLNLLDFETRKDAAQVKPSLNCQSELNRTRPLVPVCSPACQKLAACGGGGDLACQLGKMRLSFHMRCAC